MFKLVYQTVLVCFLLKIFGILVIPYDLLWGTAGITFGIQLMVGAVVLTWVGR